MGGILSLRLQKHTHGRTLHGLLVLNLCACCRAHAYAVAFDGIGAPIAGAFDDRALVLPVSLVRWRAIAWLTTAHQRFQCIFRRVARDGSIAATRTYGSRVVSTTLALSTTTSVSAPNANPRLARVHLAAGGPPLGITHFDFAFAQRCHRSHAGRPDRMRDGEKANHASGRRHGRHDAAVAQ